MLRKVLRWIRRVVLGVLGLVVVAVAAVLIALHTDWGREQVRVRVVASMHEQFPGGVQIGKIEGSVLGDLVLRDVVLRDGTGKPAISAKQVRLNVGLSSLLGGEIRLEELIIDELSVDVTLTPPEPNLVTIYKPSPEPFTWDVALQRVEIHKAAIRIDRGDGLVDHLDDVEIAATLKMRAEGPLDATLKIDGVMRDRDHAPLSLAAIAHVDDAGVEVPSLDVAAGRATLVARAVSYRGATDVRGSIVVEAPEGELARLAADDLALPALPVALAITVEPLAPDAVTLKLDGEVAGAALQGTLSATPAADRPHVGGTLAVGKLDVAQFGPALPPTMMDGRLDVDLTIDRDGKGLATAEGSVKLNAAGTVTDVVLDDVRASVVLAGGVADLAVHGEGPGGTRVDATGQLSGEARMTLRGGHLEAAVASIRDATRGKAPVDGKVELVIDVSGELGGDLPPAIEAHVVVDGRDLRHEDLRVGAVHVDAHARGNPDHLALDARVTARRLRKGRDALPDATVTARGGLDGPIAVTVDARDRGRGLAANLGATVTIGGAATADVALGDYRLAVARSEIRGRGGRITLLDDQVKVRGVRASGAGGTLAIDAMAGLGVRAGIFDGKVVLKGLDLAKARGLPGVPREVAGTLDLSADVAVSRGGRAIQGEIQASAHGLVLHRGARPIDLALSTELRPRRVEVALTVDGAELGTLSAALDVTPPRRFDDPVAWSRLDRSALRTVQLDAKALDLARLAQLVGQAPTVEGTIDASLAIDAEHASLAVRGRRLIAAGVPAPVDFDLDLDLTDPTTAAVSASATLVEVGTATVKTAVALPSRPFDLAAWTATDLRSVQGIDIEIAEVTIDDAMARRLVLGEVRGKVSAAIHAEPGLRELTAKITARDLIAGPLARPASVAIDAEVGADGTHATVELGLDGAIVATVDARAKATVTALLAGGLVPREIPLEATVRIPDTAIEPIARALGQAVALGGRVQGEVVFKGTMAAPAGTLDLVITDLASRVPRAGGAPRGGLKRLAVKANYERGLAKLELRGNQEDGGSLAVDGRVDPTRLTEATASIRASKFQLSPLARLAPDFLLGMRGLLDADLRMRGTDPKTARLEGAATLTGGQFPITDAIGNLRDAKVDLRVRNGDLHLTADGSVESGRVVAVIDGTLDGLMPRTAKLDLTIKDVTLITSLAPRASGKLVANLERNADETFTGEAWLRAANVEIPDEDGRELHPAGLPADLVFTADTRVGVPIPKTRARVLQTFLGQRPSRALLTMTLHIEPVDVVSSQFRGEVGGKLVLTAGDDGALIEGRISVPRGNVVLFERRYTLRDASVTFDGGIDPLLAIELEYDFPQLSMKAVLTGRLSDPELVLSSTPSTYTEGQLLGFLLGGSPGAAGRETVDVATGVAAALASQVIGGFVTRKLPIRLDVLNYEPTSSSSSGAFVFGRWITSKLLLLVRTRVEARIDENVNEAEVEYWLKRSLLLQGSGGDRSVLGLDLLWNRRW